MFPFFREPRPRSISNRFLFLRSLLIILARLFCFCFVFLLRLGGNENVFFLGRGRDKGAREDYMTANDNEQAGITTTCCSPHMRLRACKMRGYVSAVVGVRLGVSVALQGRRFIRVPSYMSRGTRANARGLEAFV